MPNRIVIVGGGVAAANLCTTLRECGSSASITVVSSEGRGPYERPALTKSYLTGQKTFDQITLLNAAKIIDLKIEWLSGVSCVSIDSDANSIQLSDGSIVHYGSLVICTGLNPRIILPPEVRSRVHTIRTADDVDALKVQLVTSANVAVLGGGWLGLECAAQLSEAGRAVTVIDTAKTLCARNAPREISDRLQSRHEARGTRLLMSSTMKSAGLSAHHIRLTLDNGESLNSDMVIEAIGAVSVPIPSKGKLIWTEAGIPVSRKLQTNLPDIYAIGDVAMIHPETLQDAIRVETWANAAAQGQYLARRFTGQEQAFTPDMWFWSDQAKDNVQIVGFPHIADSVERVIDEPDRMFCLYKRNGLAVGAAAFNEFKQIKIAKREFAQQGVTCV